MAKIKLFLLFSCLLFSAKARGYEIDKKKLDIAVITGIGAFWLQSYVHEKTHALVAESYGADIKNFIIGPSKIGGTIYALGRVDVDWPREPTARQLALFGIAPMINNTIIFTATELAFASGGIPRNSPYAPALFVIGELAPWIDFAKTIISSGDMKKFEEKTGLSLIVTRTIGGSLAMVGAYFMAGRFRNIFYKDMPQKKWRHPLTISPFSDIGVALTAEF